MQKTLTLTNAQAGKVIGVRGAVVRTIRQESGATIDIDHNGGDSRAIHLSGEPSQVEAAEKLIWSARHLPGFESCRLPVLFLRCGCSLSPLLILSHA